MKHLVPLWLLAAVLSVPPGLPAQGCPLGILDRITDDFYFTASSAQGAVGDVVGVDISLVIEQVHGQFISIGAVGAFDNTKAELVGSPQHSEFWDRAAPSTDFELFPRGGQEAPRAFRLKGVIRDDALRGELDGAQPVQIATVYFRLKGAPGDVVSLEFPSSFRTGSMCLESFVYYDTDTELGSLAAFSTRHVPGELRIVPGEPTRTEPPPLPPPVKVYPEPPTAENASIRFELTGAAALPVARGVPLDLYVTSNFEFSGFAVSLRFPAELVQLARLEEHTRRAGVKIDNEKGLLGMYTTNSRRRIGAEGERVLIATLYFDLEPGAAEAGEVTPTFEDVAPYMNWLEIFYQNAVVADVPVNAQVSPFVVVANPLKIQTRPTRPGDVNLDYELDLSDAVTILDHLPWRGGHALSPGRGRERRCDRRPHGSHQPPQPPLPRGPAGGWRDLLRWRRAVTHTFL